MAHLWHTVTGFRDRHCCMPMHALLCTFSGYCKIKVFCMSLLKRYTGEQTDGEVSMFIAVRELKNGHCIAILKVLLEQNFACQNCPSR